MFVEEFLVSPIFDAGGGLPAFMRARKRANRLFESGDWGRAAGAVEEASGPIDPTVF
jgi:hypothetical protein